MKKHATFNDTIAILVKAYLDGTLLKGDCNACAVGNLCASALGLPLSIIERRIKSDAIVRASAYWGDGSISSAWDSIFCTGRSGVQYRAQFLNPALDVLWPALAIRWEAGKNQLLATGYTIDQLAKIEYAFETAAPGYNEEAEFVGLMAVVSVLAEIHQVDLTTAEAAKLLFVKV